MMTVLIVEDNPGDVRLIAEMLSESEPGTTFESVETLAAALGSLEPGGIAIVLLDLGLPDSQGLRTLERIQEAAPGVPVIVLTGNIDTRMALQAVESGAQDYLVKGHFDGEVLGRVIRHSIGRKSVQQALVVSEAELLSANAQLGRMVHNLVESMGRIVELRDPYTQGHQTRVAAVAKDIAIEMGLGHDLVAGIEMAGLVHDIGKLSIPAEVLTKPGGLSDLQWLIMREHPEQGFEILKDIAFPWPVATIVRQHHERMDGSGYPHGLSGGAILIESRVIGVADVVEAMASPRPYRPAHPVATAICEIDSHREWFDPDAVDACMRLYASGQLRLEVALAGRLDATSDGSRG